MATEPEPLEALYVPSDVRTFIRKPSNIWPKPERLVANGVDAVQWRTHWLVAHTEADELTAVFGPTERTTGYKLRPGTSIPNVDLPSTTSGFYDPEYCEPDSGLVNRKWEDVYDRVTDSYTPDPKTWTVNAREVAWGLDHPELVNDLTWQPTPTAYGDDVLALWRSGYLDGCKRWIYTTIDELKIPGVEVLASSDVFHVRAMIPGKTQRAATFTAAGRKRRATVDKPLWTTFRLSPKIPTRVAGTDLLDASLKLRKVVAELEADIREVGAVACERCDGKGWRAKGKGAL
jgi:hypothetical protein